jgi:hypothetical protein
VVFACLFSCLYVGGGLFFVFALFFCAILRYISIYITIANFLFSGNKKQPPTNIQTRKQTSKHHQQKQTLTDNNQWRRKELINVHTVGFGFLLQDIWVDKPKQSV